MSQLGYSRPVDGVVRRRMEQVLPDVAPLVGVAQPGLALTPPVVQNSTLSQIGDVLNAGLAATARGIEFQAAMQDRAERQRREAEADRLRTEEGMAKIEQQFSAVRQGDAARAWSTDKAIILGQIDRGEVQMPASMSEQDLRSWASGVIAPRVDGQGDIFAQTYTAAAENDLIAAIQRKAATVAQRDREETVASLSQGAALAASTQELDRAVSQARSLNLTEREAVSEVILPAARLAATTGADNYETVFRPRLDSPEFALQRTTLDLAFREAKAQQEQDRIRVQAQAQRAVEIASANQIRSYQDVVNSELAAAGDDEEQLLRVSQNWLNVTRETSANNPQFATELSGVSGQLSAIRDSIVQKQQRRLVDESLNRQQQSLFSEGVAMYRAGGAIAIPSSDVRVETTLPDGTVESRSVPNFRRRVQEAAVANAPTLADKVRMLEVDTMKFEPWVSVLQTGAQAADRTKFGNTQGQTDIAPNTLEAVRLYTEIAAVNQSLADSYAGDHKDFYRDVVAASRISGVGNDVSAAVRQVIVQRQNADGSAPSIPDNDIESIVNSVGGKNTGDVSRFVRVEAERQMRLTGKTRDDAVRDVKERAAQQFKVVNGYNVRTYDAILPPGDFGSFEKTAEAYIGGVASKATVPGSASKEDIMLKINPTDGTILLVDYKTGLPPAGIPVADRELTIDELYRRTRKMRLQGLTGPSPFEQINFAAAGANRFGL